MGNIAKTEIIEKLNSQEFGERMSNFLRGMVRTMFMEQYMFNRLKIQIRKEFPSSASPAKRERKA